MSYAFWLSSLQTGKPTASPISPALPLEERPPDLLPELLDDDAVDDKVDGGVEDEEEVGDGEEEEDGDGDAVAAVLLAEDKVLHGLVGGVGELVDLEGEAVGLARQKDEDDGH